MGMVLRVCSGFKPRAAYAAQPSFEVASSKATFQRGCGQLRKTSHKSTNAAKQSPSVRPLEWALSNPQ